MGKKSQKQSKGASPAKDAAKPAPAPVSTSTAGAALFAAKPSGSFDAELDAFFKAAPPPAAPSATNATTKRKAQDASTPSSAKKARADEYEHQEAESNGDNDEEEAGDGEGDLSELDEAEIEAMADLMDADDSSDEIDEMLPSKDVKEAKEEFEDEAEVEEELTDDPDADEGEDEDEDEDERAGKASRPKSAFPIVHESLLKKGAHKRKNAKFEDVDEPAELKDKRTLFVGNVPIEAVKSKSLQKRLKRHLTSLSPYPGVTKITSLRFRSIPFAVPTDDFDADSEAAAAKLAKRRERSKNYKEALAVVEGKEASSAHQFLTAKQKRKVAYINQDLNSHADTVNAYVTLGYPDAVFRHINKRRLARQQDKEAAAAANDETNAESEAKTKKPKADDKKAVAAAAATADEMEGFDARLTAPVLAALLAAVADGQLFEGRHLRVDLVKPLDVSEVMAAGLDKVTTAEGSLIGSGASATTDPKRTLFVGNLDFEVKEEEIRSFFEKLLTEERGSPPDTVIPIVGLDGKPPVQPKQYGSWEGEDKDGGETSDDESEDEDEDEDEDEEDEQKSASTVPALHASAWVRSVRVIRDKATQMGKGIAYVRFLDTECVDEIMAIHEAEEAFFASARGGGSGGGKGVSNTALASTAIAVGGKQSEFRRRLKLRKRAVRVARCKATTAGGGRGKGKGGEAQGAKRKREEGSRDSKTVPTTPLKGYARSSGAPTPNGSSPKPRRDGPFSSSTKVGGMKQQQTTPTKTKPAPPPASAATLEKAAMLAKLDKQQRNEVKKNDEERRKRRLEKKEKKKKASVVLKDAGRGRERVKLPSKVGKAGAKGKGKADKGKGVKAKAKVGKK
ncbi:Nucleolar protein 12 [Thecaphora frezii]